MPVKQQELILETLISLLQLTISLLLVIKVDFLQSRLVGGEGDTLSREVGVVITAEGLDISRVIQKTAGGMFLTPADHDRHC